MNEAPGILTVQALKSPELSDGDGFTTLVLLRKAATRTARNDNPFLVVEFGDRSGAFTTNCFTDSPVYETLRTAGEGAVLRICGRIDHYQGRLSPRLLSAQVLDPAALEPSTLDSLFETAPEGIDALAAELDGFAASIAHDGLRAVVQQVFSEYGAAFRTSPAALQMHHAYRGGLLEHTVHMARVASRVLPLYPEVDPSLAMAGILLHDIGKVSEYESGAAIRKTRRGILHGHVVLGFQAVRKAGLVARLDPVLLERLEHIILSHQGELQWGAATLAATPEAVFVSMVDNLDARMGMVQRALRQAPPGEEFTERLAGLNAPLLTTPPTTGPQPEGRTEELKD